MLAGRPHSPKRDLRSTIEAARIVLDPTLQPSRFFQRLLPLYSSRGSIPTLSMGPRDRWRNWNGSSAGFGRAGQTRIVIRADSGFCRDDFAPLINVDYVMGLAKNDRLKSEIAEAMRPKQSRHRRGCSRISATGATVGPRTGRQGSARIVVTSLSQRLARLLLCSGATWRTA